MKTFLDLLDDMVGYPCNPNKSEMMYHVNPWNAVLQYTTSTHSVSQSKSAWENGENGRWALNTLLYGIDHCNS